MCRVRTDDTRPINLNLAGIQLERPMVSAFRKRTRHRPHTHTHVPFSYLAEKHAKNAENLATRTANSYWDIQISQSDDEYSVELQCVHGMLQVSVMYATHTHTHTHTCPSYFEFNIFSHILILF